MIRLFSRVVTRFGTGMVVGYCGDDLLLRLPLRGVQPNERRHPRTVPLIFRVSPDDIKKENEDDTQNDSLL
jgi:hypothetical protein